MLVVLAIAALISTVHGIPIFMGAGFQAFDQPNGAICPGGIFRPRYVLASTEVSFLLGFLRRPIKPATFKSTAPLSHKTLQNWWRRELMPPTGSFGTSRDFGHLHNEQCLPQLVKAPNGQFKVVTRVHQNPGTVKYVLLTDATGLVSTDINSAQFKEPRSASLMETTDGILVMNATDKSKRDVRWIDTLKFNATDFVYGGVVSMKTSISVDEDEQLLVGNRRMKALVTTRTILNNGNPDSGINPNDPGENVIFSSGWGSDVQYTTVKLWMPPKVPIGGIWRVKWAVYPGTETSAAITRHVVTFNANFHMDIPGIVAINDTGGFDGMSVFNVHDPKYLGPDMNGWNKISFQGKALAKDGATNTGALGLQFQVSNGANCSNLVQTHAKSEAAVTVRDKTTSYIVERDAFPGVKTSIQPWFNSKLRAAEFTYDLSFFKGPNGILNAKIWVYVFERIGADITTLYAFDGDATTSTTACVDPTLCSPVGQGALSVSGRWSMVKITDEAFLAKAVANKELKVILSVGNGTSSASIRGATTSGSPPLLIKPRCL